MRDHDQVAGWGGGVGMECHQGDSRIPLGASVCQNFPAAAWNRQRFPGADKLVKIVERRKRVELPILM